MTRAVHPVSLWASSAPYRAPATALQGQHEVAVAVVGGGFTGLSSALRLAEAGEQVVLLEGSEVGAGASGRNNGQVIPTMSAIEPDAIVARFGETGERFVRLIADSADGLFRTVAAHAIECEAEQNGWFQPAHSPGRLRLSEQRVEAWCRYGAPASLLDQSQASELLGSDSWYGGLFNPTGGHINPLALVRGLARAATEAGVVIHEHTPVTHLARRGDRWQLDTAAGQVLADQVVLATNAYTDALVPGLAPLIARSVVPVLSWQMATEPLGENLRRVILPGRQAVSDTRADLRFFRYDARHRLVTGGAVTGAFRAAERVQQTVAQRLSYAWPGLGKVNFDYIWSGRIGITRDRYPHIHHTAPGLWSWVGCNGRGVALSMALGAELCKAVRGLPASDLAVPLTTPQPIPGHALVRRVAPLALAWYRRADRREPNVRSPSGEERDP